MCGVFATNRPDIWTNKTGRLLELLRHRGPDADGVWSEDGVLLIHTRLSIIGLGTDGAQPRTSTDGNIVLAYNGEIYNYRDLPTASSPKFFRSDTAVLAELLATKGDNCLPEINGMYAFAAWNRATRTLCVARDPYGIKPLYILRHASGGVAISSELPPLLECEEGRTVDPIGLGSFLAFGHTGPLSTIYLNVSKLRPGTSHSWTAAGNGWVERAKRTEFQPPLSDEPELHAALTSAVSAHLIADVPVGLFLSGGVDSTLIAACAREQCADVRAFTLGFPDHPDLDESDFAAANAAQLHIPLSRVGATAQDMVGMATGVISAHGEPFGDAAVLPLAVLSARAAVDVKVVLGGEGSDELFGGYGRYRVSRRIDRLPRVWGRALGSSADLVGRYRTDLPAHRALEAVLRGPGFPSHAALLGADVGWFRRQELPHIEDIFSLAFGEWLLASDSRSDFQRARDYDKTCWLPNVYLEKTDIATMHSGIEGRVPFLDQELRRWIHYNRPTDKAALRALLSTMVPTVSHPARKKGLAVPVDDLLNAGLLPFMQRALHEPSGNLQSVLGSHWVRALQTRAARSATTRFRLAMVGVWEEYIAK